MLYGLKFFDATGNLMIEIGDQFEHPRYRKWPEKYTFREFILEEGERLLGFKSSGRGFGSAEHYDF